MGNGSSEEVACLMTNYMFKKIVATGVKCEKMDCMTMVIFSNTYDTELPTVVWYDVPTHTWRAVWCDISYREINVPFQIKNDYNVDICAWIVDLGLNNPALIEH